MQLPFAVIPLIRFTNDRRRMGEFANRAWVRMLAWAAAAVISGLEPVAGGGSRSAPWVVAHPPGADWRWRRRWRPFSCSWLDHVRERAGSAGACRSRGGDGRGHGRRRSARAGVSPDPGAARPHARATAPPSRTPVPLVALATARRCTCCTSRKASPAAVRLARLRRRGASGRGVFPRNRRTRWRSRASPPSLP